MKRFLLAAVVQLHAFAYLRAQPPIPAIPSVFLAEPATVTVQHPRGLKLPSLDVRRASHLADARRHAIHNAKLAMRLAEPLPSSFDCRTFPVATGGTVNLCTAIKDQGQCGSCWDHSMTEVVESANIKVNNLPLTSPLSTQFALDGCAFSNGGCDGDDASNGFTWLKAGGGLPLASVYGPYVAYAESCQLSTTATGYTINDYGYCSQSTGVPSSDQIKAAMLIYGPISVCMDASSMAFNNYTSGVLTGDGQSIDHQVVVVGWVDDATVSGGGYWIGRNSWGTGWGINGYFYIAYGADSFGTEAMWVTAGTPVVLQPSAPTPQPGPTPTRRLADLRVQEAMVELKSIDLYYHGTPAQQKQVLDLLDKREAELKATKQALGIAN